MKIVLLGPVIGLTVLVLSGCACTTLKSPCPNFGRYCQKVPINRLDYQKK